MKKLVVTLMVIAIFPALSILSELEALTNERHELFTARNRLLGVFSRLSLQQLSARSSSYLQDLNAGYDEDNQCFFIEQSDKTGSFAGASYLILVDYRRQEETQISIFSPEDQQYMWLRSRITVHAGVLHARVIFQPVRDQPDLVHISYPVSMNNRISMSH